MVFSYLVLLGVVKQPDFTNPGWVFTHVTTSKTLVCGRYQSPQYQDPCIELSKAHNKQDWRRGV